MKKKKLIKLIEDKINYGNLRRHPFICPVCGGSRIVNNGFYNTVSGIGSTTSATPEQCKTCMGTGIVWG